MYLISWGEFFGQQILTNELLSENWSFVKSNKVKGFKTRVLKCLCKICLGELHVRKWSESMMLFSNYDRLNGVFNEKIVCV